MGRAYNLYAWYSVLKVVNKLYEDQPDPPPFAEFQSRLEEVNKDILESALKTFDDSLVENNDIQVQLTQLN